MQQLVVATGGRSGDGGRATELPRGVHGSSVGIQLLCVREAPQGAGRLVVQLMEE